MPNRIKIDKIGRILNQIPQSIGKHAFSFFGLLLGIILILGALLFYQYSVLPLRKESPISVEELEINQEQYEQVKNAWARREEKFRKADSKQFPDPFWLTKAEPEEESEETEEGSQEEEPKEPEETEEPISPSSDLRQASTLSEFYQIKGQSLPSVNQRAAMWEERGLGSSEYYIGAPYQNLRLLEALKQELTQ